MTNIAKPTETMIDALLEKLRPMFGGFGFGPIAREAYETITAMRSSAPQEPDDAECPTCEGRGDVWVFANGLGRAPDAEECGDCLGTGRAYKAQEPVADDDELIERLKDMRDFCRGTTHTHPHPNNVARLCEDVLAVLQAKAPETGEPQ